MGNSAARTSKKTRSSHFIDTGSVSRMCAPLTFTDSNKKLNNFTLASNAERRHISTLRDIKKPGIIKNVSANKCNLTQEYTSDEIKNSCKITDRFLEFHKELEPSEVNDLSFEVPKLQDNDNDNEFISNEMSEMTLHTADRKIGNCENMIIEKLFRLSVFSDDDCCSRNEGGEICFFHD